MTSEEILGTKDVAQILKVSVRSVTRLADAGEIHGFKVGDLWRFRRSEVDAFIERQEEKARQKHPPGDKTSD